MTRTIIDATREARERAGVTSDMRCVGDEILGVAVRAGRCQVQRIVRVKGGRSDIQPLSDWMGVKDTITFLDGIEAS